MKFILYGVLYSYLFLMGTSGVLAFLRQQIPFYLMCLNVGFALIGICSPLSPCFLWISLIGLLGTACLNGLILNGRIQVIHLSSRLLLSVLLLLFYYLNK